MKNPYRIRIEIEPVILNKVLKTKKDAKHKNNLTESSNSSESKYVIT